MRKEMSRLLFAAAASGSGKTTVVCAILRALVRRGTRVASFKCGPDYIDPMFHRESVGAEYSSNLDLFLGDENTARRLLAARECDIAVIEGVMGYYDGLGGVSEDASSYALARATETPTVLIVNCRGMSVSIAAQVKGFTAFRRDSGIIAVLLNNLSAPLYPTIKELIERECGVAVAGYLPPMANCSLESRRLGLVAADEVENLRQKLDLLAEQAIRTVDFALLLALAAAAPPLEYEPLTPAASVTPVRIAVARDHAFCFYYADSLALLEQLGARLVPFSPLADEHLPAKIDALLLGGGYPELHAARLSANETMRGEIKTAIDGGLPTIAECGGFLYLHSEIEDESGVSYPMAGVLTARGYKTERLNRFGYLSMTAKADNLLCRAGESLPAHAFHYWESTDEGDCFTTKKPLRETAWDCAVAGKSLYAGFPHLYLAGRPQTATRFLEAAVAYRKERER